SGGHGEPQLCPYELPRVEVPGLLALQEAFDAAGQGWQPQLRELAAKCFIRRPLHRDALGVAPAQDRARPMLDRLRHENKRAAFVEEADAGLGLPVAEALERPGICRSPDRVPSDAPADPGLVEVGAERVLAHRRAAVRL